MNFEYKKINYPEESINLCTDHAIELNGGVENVTDDLVFRNPLVEEVPNCIVCEGEKTLDELFKILA